MDKNEFNAEALKYIHQIVHADKIERHPGDSVGQIGLNVDMLIQFCKDNPLDSLTGEDDSFSRLIHEAVEPSISVAESDNYVLMSARKNQLIEKLKEIDGKYVSEETEAVGATEIPPREGEKASYDFNEIDTKYSDELHLGKKGEKMRLKAIKTAFKMGFSKEACHQIGEEIGNAYKYNKITGRKQVLDDLLYHSKTFRESDSGMAYLKEMGYHVDVNSLAYQDALSQKRELLDIDAIASNWVTKPKASTLSARTMDLWGWIRQSEGYEAIRVAQRLGYSPEEVERINREVNDLSSSQNSLKAKVMRKLFGGSALTTDQLLFQSETFRSHPELAKPYLGLRQIESKESQFEGYVASGEKLNEKLGDEKQVLPTVKGYMGFDDPMKEQAAYEAQSSGKNRFGSFLSSGVGFVLMAIALFSIFKLCRVSPVGSVASALGGSTLLNLIGRTMTSGISQQCQSAGNIEGMMREVGMAAQRSDEEQAAYQLQNTRDIPIGQEQQQELSESDYRRYVQENGFRGLRQLLINDPWKYREFVQSNGLIEAEQQETMIFRQNGDWLSYTRKALGDKIASANPIEHLESQQVRIKN